MNATGLTTKFKHAVLRLFLGLGFLCVSSLLDAQSPIAVTPSSATLAPGASVSFTANYSGYDGTATYYVWDASQGGTFTNGPQNNIKIYTAPTTVGSYYVSVGNYWVVSAVIHITVANPLILTTTTTAVAPGQAIEVTATGGDSGQGAAVYQWSSTPMYGTFAPGTMSNQRVWTAPSQTGTYVLSVSSNQAPDWQAWVQIIVANPATITPTLATVTPGQTLTLTAGGGGSSGGGGIGMPSISGTGAGGGLGTSTFDWACSAGTLVDPSGTGVLTTPSLSRVWTPPITSGTYTVRVAPTGTLGTALQAKATLTVAWPLPIIATFAPDSSTINEGQSTTLRWNVTGQGNLMVQLYANGQNMSWQLYANGTLGADWTLGDLKGLWGPSPLVGSLAVTPAATTVYTLQAYNQDGMMVNQSKTVIVVLKPKIESFTATATNIKTGQSTTLSWVVTGATTLTLNGTAVAASGSQTFSPTATTTYTLTATNSAGSRYASVTVDVSVTSPVINSFNYSPSPLTQNQPFTLTWNASNAQSVWLLVDGTTGPGIQVPAVGSQPYSSLRRSTTYLLHAYNAAGMTERTLTVVVELATNPPTITKFVPSPSTVGIGQTLQLWMNVDGADQIYVDQGAGSYAGGTHVINVTAPNTPGILTYTLTATNRAGSTTKPCTVTVQSGSIPSVGITPPFVSLAPGGTQVFTATVQGSSNTSVNWSVSPAGGTGGTIDSNGVYTAPTIAGTYTVTAKTVQDPLVLATATVTVAPLPVINFFTASPTRVAQGAGSTLQWNVQNADSVVLEGISGSQLLASTYPTGPLDQTTTYTLIAQLGDVFVRRSVTVQVAGLVWVRNIVYLGAREVAEVDKDGMHTTLTDHLGSPRFMLDAAGMPETTEQKFMPFGESLTDTATRKQYAKGFTNHEQTDADGLIYMQARFYAPIYGRFLSPDPGMDQHFDLSQSWNIYSYVQNNPVSKIDTFGLYEMDVHLMLTTVLARAAGFNQNRAEAIGRATQQVDEDSRSPVQFSFKLKQIHADWHFTNDQRRKDLWSNFEEHPSEASLGDFLHPYQDSFSHAGYEPGVGHAKDGHAPDKTYNDPDKANGMALQTYQKLLLAAKKMGADTKSLDWNKIRIQVDIFNRAHTEEEKQKAIGNIYDIIGNEQSRAGKKENGKGERKYEK